MSIQPPGPRPPQTSSTRPVSSPSTAAPSAAAGTPVSAEPQAGRGADSFRPDSRASAAVGRDAALEPLTRLRRNRGSRGAGEPDPARPLVGEVLAEALLADNAGLVQANPAGAELKLQQLASSAFAFFRGTPGLFYRALAGTDSEMPQVLCNGDAHPENFGVAPDADGKLVFGLNDFDHAAQAPFTWDLQRSAVGFELAARERGFSAGQRQRIAEAFAGGYLDAMRDFVGTDKERTRRQTKKDKPKVIRRLLENAEGASRKSFLQKSVDLKTERFLPSEEVHPEPERREEIQEALDRYRKALGKDAPGKGFFKVKDVAAKTGSGTDSLGLERHWVLVQGPSKKPEDDVILELKQETGSALAPFTVAPSGAGSAADGVAEAERVQSTAADPLYGSLTLGSAPESRKSFVVRERSPFKSGLDWRALDYDDFQDYARTAGALLAQAHARSDETQADNERVEASILRAVDAKTFPAELARAAGRGADRLTTEFRSFLDLQAARRFAPGGGG
jgi:uncharacterized protein (DUF2252 family)